MVDNTVTTNERELFDNCLVYLRQHRHNHSIFFTPTAEFYNQLSLPNGAENAAKQLFRWLGVKPQHFQIIFTDKQTNIDTNNLYINSDYSEHPYQLGTIISLFVLRYCLETYSGKPLPPQVLELLSIETGFGIVILNGLPGHTPVVDRLYHHIHNNSHIRLAQPLLTIRPANYAQHMLTYARDNHTHSQSWYRYTNKSARQYLRLRTRRFPHAMPVLESEHYESARRWLGHLFLLAVFVALSVTLALYIVAQLSSF